MIALRLSRPVLPALVAIVLATGPLLASAQSTPSLLQTPAVVLGGVDVRSSAGPASALRWRPAVVRTEVLMNADGSPRLRVGDRLELNLFDDARFTATITDVSRNAAGGASWSGRLDGRDDAHMVLAVYDNAVVGTIWIPGAVYQIGHAPDGTQVVEQLDPGAFPREAEAVPPPAEVPPPPAEIAADAQLSPITFPDTPVGSSSTVRCRSLCFGSSCSASGTVQSVSGPSAPFSLEKFNVLSQSELSSGNCEAHPVSLPVTLNAGQTLAYQATFAPTAAGPFNSSATFNSPAGAATVSLTGLGGADTASQIDVMVLYTAAARTAAGGTNAIRAEAAAAVAAANLAYANNGLTQRQRLVFTGEIQITEAVANDPTGPDLATLKSNQTVAWLRDANRADLVGLLTSYPPGLPFSGRGGVMTTLTTAFAPNAFSVNSRTAATANLTFPHETGHNMGADHDPYVTSENQAVPLFPYSHGYVDVGARFRTIMAYPDKCTAAGVSCTRIPFYSSPNQTYTGHVIGDAAISDNARTLAQTGDTVANFRQALAPPLSLSVGTNQASFGVGQTVVVSGIVNNPGVGLSADFYIGVLLPDGSVLFFTAGAPGYALGSVSDLSSFRPLATGVPLGASFSANVPNFFSYRWSGAEPTGGYAFFMLVTKAGGLSAGLKSAQILGTAFAPFSFIP